MLVLDATVVNVALPRIDADLGFGPASLQLGPQRLHAGLRRAAPARRPAGRRARPAAGSSRPGWPCSCWSRCSAAWPRPELLVAARALQGVGRPWPHRACWPCSPPARPTRPSGNRALALFGAVSSAGASIGLLLGGVLTDIGSWRWTLFINVPIGMAVLAAGAALRHRDRAPSRPLRRGRCRDRDPRCGRDRLVADRYAGARLGLRPHHRRLRGRGRRRPSSTVFPVMGQMNRDLGPRMKAAVATVPNSRRDALKSAGLAADMTLALIGRGVPEPTAQLRRARCAGVQAGLHPVVDRRAR